MPLVLKSNTYTFFDLNGVFVTLYTGLNPEIQEGFGYIDNVADFETMYIPDVNTPVATDKLAHGITIDTSAITADGISTATISGITNSSVASFEVPFDAASISDQTISDGTLAFTATKPGDYLIKIALFPYLDYEVTVTAT